MTRDSRSQNQIHDKVITFYIDALYVINGIANLTNQYLNGMNGDLWGMLKSCLDPIRQYCTFIKVKSHLDDPSKWQEYDMTIPAYLCNNGADAAADAKAKLLQTEKGQM